MQQINYPSRENWNEILARPAIENKLLNKQVSKILGDVRTGGDKTLKKLAKKFDGVVIKSIQVAQQEIDQAEGKLSVSLKEAILVAANNIRMFHSAQIVPISKIETTKGVFCWRKSLPIERVGLYIPGGSAPLFSTILMLGIPAALAGCKEIILCTSKRISLL